MVFQDVTPCFLVCRYEDYGVQNATLRGLICGFEGYGVLGCDTMFFFWYIDIKIMVFQDVTPCFLVCGYQYYGVLECDTMWLATQVSRLWFSGLLHYVLL